MAFSIHFLEACRASQVSDKNCFSSQQYSWLGLLSFERRGDIGTKFPGAYRSLVTTETL